MVKATGVILAGGKSRRMGVDKAFLAVGCEAMIERVAIELAKVFDEVLISGGSADAGRKLGLKVLPDLILGGGPLSGIHASLKGSSHEKCLFVACDMPFVNSSLARFMIEQSEGYDAVVPQHGIFYQPLFAVYSRACIQTIEEFLASRKYKIADFYSHVRVNFISEKYLQAFADIDTMFFNVNTPVDLEKARGMAENNNESGAPVVKDPIPKDVCFIDPGSQAQNTKKPWPKRDSI